MVYPLVSGWLDTPAGEVPKVSPVLTADDKRGTISMRIGIGRDSYAITPGLYAFGEPNENSHVIVTCNYKLTFDHLRSTLSKLDLWVVVLDTKGINVWCAAGKGTFGTAEVIKRVNESSIDKVVNHRDLILPQLGAPGVSAQEVKRATGFKVHYGPIRAEDITAYLDAGMVATPSMREATFTLKERAVLIPVEISLLLSPLKWVIPLLFILSGLGPSIWSPSAAVTRGFALFMGLFAGGLGGAVFLPLLLPYLFWREFSLKGAAAGAGVTLIGLLLFGGALNWLEALSLIVLGSAVASYAGMNFTGTTPFTSPTSVEKEMRRWVPIQIGTAALSLAGWVGGAFIG
ncbi:MAG: hypothetical protein C0608_05795 [Deltaproteobacteria bacterium]|nr:MAG: hypothetical protein C0608_05795 [Deltaproteobacteria bacterium]